MRRQQICCFPAAQVRNSATDTIIIPLPDMPGVFSVQGAIEHLLELIAGHIEVPVAVNVDGASIVGDGVHEPLSVGVVSADNISVAAIDSESWSNVQEALAGLYNRKDDAPSGALYGRIGDEWEPVVDLEEPVDPTPGRIWFDAGGWMLDVWTGDEWAPFGYGISGHWNPGGGIGTDAYEITAYDWRGDTWSPPASVTPFITNDPSAIGLWRARTWLNPDDNSFFVRDQAAWREIGYLKLTGGWLTGDLGISTNIWFGIQDVGLFWKIYGNQNGFAIDRLPLNVAALAINNATGTVSIANDLSVGGNLSIAGSASIPGYLPLVGAALPNADPHSSGALWADGDIVKISAG